MPRNRRPVVDPLPTNAIRALDQFLARLHPMLDDHDNACIEFSPRMVDIRAPRSLPRDYVLDRNLHSSALNIGCLFGSFPAGARIPKNENVRHLRLVYFRLDLVSIDETPLDSLRSSGQEWLFARRFPEYVTRVEADLGFYRNHDNQDAKLQALSVDQIGTIPLVNSHNEVQSLLNPLILAKLGNAEPVRSP